MSKDTDQQQDKTEVPKGISKSETDPETNTRDFAYYANQADQLFLSHLTLGIEEKLKKNKMIKEVKLSLRKSCDKNLLNAWERRYQLSLPKDFRDYYMSTNGFKLTWSLEHAGEILRIGDMNLNSLNLITPIESPPPNTSTEMGPGSSSSNSISTMTMGKGSDVKHHKKQHDKNDILQMSFGEFQQMINKSVKPRHTTTTTTSSSSNNLESLTKSVQPQSQSRLTLNLEGKAFRLDCNRSGWGTTCLVYPTGKNASQECQISNTPTIPATPLTSISSKGQVQEQLKALVQPKVTATTTNKEPNCQIWFIDPSYQWHFLAPTFTHYYRMLLIHLGLPQWQYRFTPFGLSSWAEQMFWLVAPHLLQPPKISNFPTLYTGLWSPEFPTEASTPNPVNNTITINIFKKKKKLDKSQK